MRIAIGSDHRGFEAKQQIKAFATELGHECIDFGTDDNNPVDYPDLAYLAAGAVAMLPRWARRPLRLPWLPVTEHLVGRPLGGAATSVVRWAMRTDEDVRHRRTA